MHRTRGVNGHVSLVLVVTSMAASACGGEPAVGEAEPIRTSQENLLVSEDYEWYRLWEDGILPYKFDSSISSTVRGRFATAVGKWNDGLNPEVNIVECVASNPSGSQIICPTNYIKVVEGDGNSCGDGEATGAQILTLEPDVDAGTISHELGHCLGTPHEMERKGRDKWLRWTSEAQAAKFYQNSEARNPNLGNFNFDSILMYSSRGSSGFRYTDYWGSELVRTWPAPGDFSRALQLYAREYQNAWGFFRSLSGNFYNSNDTLPDPYLDDGVSPIGTPAVAVDRSGTHGFQQLWHVLQRGTDNNIYHKRMWTSGNEVSSDPWESIGCCSDSDPAAVALANGDVVAAFIGATSGKVLKTTYHRDTGDWGDWFIVKGGLPNGAVKTTTYALPDGGEEDGHVGVGISSRSGSKFDIIAAREDGGLGIVSWTGSAYTDWSTERTSWTVWARPAAAASAAGEVRVALNVDYSVRQLRLTFDTSDNLLGTGSATNDGGNLSSKRAPVGIAMRSNGTWRIVAINQDERVEHWFSHLGEWRDIGGIPQYRTGVAVDWVEGYKAKIVMNGEDMKGCDTSCLDPKEGVVRGQFIQPGGLWIRHFE